MGQNLAVEGYDFQILKNALTMIFIYQRLKTEFQMYAKILMLTVKE